MATEKQIAANQANAQKSSGPVTAAGKARSSMNRLSWGFCSNTILMPGEDPREFGGLHEDLTAHSGKPQGTRMVAHAGNHPDSPVRPHSSPDRPEVGYLDQSGASPPNPRQVVLLLTGPNLSVNNLSVADHRLFFVCQAAKRPTASCETGFSLSPGDSVACSLAGQSCSGCGSAGRSPTSAGKGCPLPRRALCQTTPPQLDRQWQ